MRKKPNQAKSLIASCVAAGIALCSIGGSAKAEGIASPPSITEIDRFKTENLEYNQRDYVEASGPAFDKTGNEVAKFKLRCGLKPNGSYDPSIQDFSVWNDAQGTYTRYQKIGRTSIATANNPDRTLSLQMMGTNGAVSASVCSPDRDDDTLKECTAAKPFMPVGDLAKQMARLTKDCDTMMGLIKSQLDTSSPSPDQIAEFNKYRDGLKQKVDTLKAGPGF